MGFSAARRRRRQPAAADLEGKSPPRACAVYPRLLYFWTVYASVFMSVGGGVRIGPSLRPILVRCFCLGFRGAECGNAFVHFFRG